MLTMAPKDPNEVLDYQFNWAAVGASRLDTGETLVTSTWTVVEGDVVIDDQEFEANGLTTVWLSGGTINTRCKLLNRVTTSNGRTYDQSARLRIREK